jgi:manganese oxidase
LVLQTHFGLVGALVCEPRGSTWVDDPSSHAFATVTKCDKQVFRECVLVLQNMVSKLTPGRGNLANLTDGREAGFGAVNYRTESFMQRGPRPPSGLGAVLSPDVGFANIFSNGLLIPNPDNLPPPTIPLKAIGEPETPIFEAVAGTPVRFRVVMPSTTSANSAAQPPGFTIHGHGWQDEPYVKRSTEIGHNDMAQFIGSQEVTVTQKYDIVIDSAGGPFRVPGDYLYQAFNQEQKMGIWGLFRVTAPAKK